MEDEEMIEMFFWDEGDVLYDTVMAELEEYI